MSLEHVIKALMNLGLSKVESKIYVFIALNGPQKAKQITESMKLTKQQIYRSLKNLQKQNIVLASLEAPAVFSAVSFEKVLELLSIKKLAQARALEKLREELLDRWQELIKDNSLVEDYIFSEEDENQQEVDC